MHAEQLIFTERRKDAWRKMPLFLHETPDDTSGGIAMQLAQRVQSDFAAILSPGATTEGLSFADQDAVLTPLFVAPQQRPASLNQEQVIDAVHALMDAYFTRAAIEPDGDFANTLRTLIREELLQPIRPHESQENVSPVLVEAFKQNLGRGFAANIILNPNPETSEHIARGWAPSFARSSGEAFVSKAYTTQDFLGYAIASAMSEFASRNISTGFVLRTVQVSPPTESPFSDVLGIDNMPWWDNLREAAAFTVFARGESENLAEFAFLHDHLQRLQLQKLQNGLDIDSSIASLATNIAHGYDNACTSVGGTIEIVDNPRRVLCTDFAPPMEALLQVWRKPDWSVWYGR